MKDKLAEFRAEALQSLKLEELEHAIEEERAHSAALREQVNELRFKIQILEKSYAKQLEDARLRAEAAERKTADQSVRLTELDTARNDAIELLAEAQAELERLEQERNQLSRQLAARDGWEVEPGGSANDYSGDGGTINALMSDAFWAKKAESGKPLTEGEASPPAAAEEESTGDMLAPELILTARGKRD